MKIIIWYGLRRSGNHGLLQLLMNSLTFKYFFHNNVELSHAKILQNIENEILCYRDIQYLLVSIENKLINFEEIKKFKNHFEIVKVLYPVKNVFGLYL